MSRPLRTTARTGAPLLCKSAKYNRLYEPSVEDDSVDRSFASVQISQVQ